MTVVLTACSDDPAGWSGAECGLVAVLGVALGVDQASPSLVRRTGAGDPARGRARKARRWPPGRYAMDFGSDRADTPIGAGRRARRLRGRRRRVQVRPTTARTAFRHFDAWTVATVATAPCGDTEWVDPGPGVDDLAEHWRRCPVWETTPPVAADRRRSRRCLHWSSTCPAERPGRVPRRAAQLARRAGSTKGSARARPSACGSPTWTGTA